ncbi:MAG: hypothetical protein JRN21_09495 [Nitrososphaerota archaeon]|nr:hypothetical protein [Nitrososphaerota archaeon]
MSAQETEKKYYTPPAAEQPVPLNIDKEQTQYAEDLTALGGSNGVIEMKLEQSVVMARLSKDIYKDFKSGFRELFANAVSACTLAKEIFKSKPRVDITLNPKTRELSIREFDSIGMSTEVFKEVYTVVGRSGNFDRTRPGQFGFGRLAWVTLSDRMILETHYRTPDGKTGKYAVQGQNASSFVVLPKPTLNTFGTTVKLVLYDEINICALVKYIIKACELSKVDTYLTLTSGIGTRKQTNTTDDDEDDDEEYDDDGELSPSTFKAGTTKLNVTYHQKVVALTNGKSDYSVTGASILKEYMITGSGWEMYGAFLTEKESSGLKKLVFANNSSSRTYLIGLPIEADISLPFSVWYVNVLDEGKFQPTADRERLKDKAGEELLAQITAEIRKTFIAFNVSDLVGYLNLPADDRIILSGGNAAFRGYVDNRTVQVIESLTGYIKWKNAEQHKSASYDNDSLSHVLASVPSTDKIFIEPARFVERHNQIIFALLPDAVIVNCRDDDNKVNLLVGAGAKLAKDYIATIPRSQRPKPLHSGTGHSVGYVTTYGATSYSRSTPEIEAVQSIPSNAIRIPRKVGLEAYKNVMASGIQTDYVLVSDSPDYGEQGLKFDEFITSIAKTKVETNHGAIAIEGLSANRPTLIPYDRPEMVRLLSKDKNTIVIGTTDRIFEIMFYRTYKGLKYEVDLDAGSILRRYTPRKVWDNRYNNDANEAFDILTIYFVVKNKNLARLLIQAYDEDAQSVMKTLFKIPDILDESVMKQIQP